MGEFDGPTLSLTTTLEGRVQLVWTTVPDAFYNLRYGTGDRSKIIYVTDTQWIGDLFATGANTVTFSVVAITSQGVSRESNVVSLGPSGEVALGSGVRLAQLALTPADCERLTQQVEYQQHRVVNTSSEVRDRQIWINTGPAQCLSLLANQLGQLGSDIFWSCELVLQPARIIGISRIPAQYTLGWVGKFFGSALAGIGVNQLCNQIKTLTNWSTGVLTLRETADSCGSGSARWTLRIDKITTITPGVEGQPPRVSEKYEFKAYDVQCVQPKPIRYIGPDRIVYTDGTYEIVDPNTVRNAILSLMLALQPLTWTKTEAIAHRADRVSSPDNTHEAIKRAFEKGAKYIEVDTQLASDGQVIIAHGSVYKLNQGFVPDAPTVVYGPTDACHGKNMEVDVTPFLTGNCDVGIQMALASEGESWTPKFRGERYPILQNVISTPAYSDYCGWFIELKKSEHPSADKAERNRQLGETVQALLEAQGAIERCANRGQNVWVTSFEDSALAGVTDDRIHKLRVVSRFSLGDWTQRIADWLSRGYDGVAIDLAVADEVVEGKSLPEYIRSRGLKAVAYTLLPGSQSQSTNQEAIDKKFDFFLTDILDDLLIRNGDKQPITPFYTVTLSAGEARALVIRNHEVYPVTTTLFLDSYGNGTQPLPIGPVVPGDGWVSLLFDTFPTSADTLVVEKTEVTLYRRPAYETPNYATLGFYQTYPIGQQTVGALARGTGVLSVTMQHQNYSNVKPKMVDVGLDRAQFIVNGIPMPTRDGRNEVIICPRTVVPISGRLTPAAGWKLRDFMPARLFLDEQPLLSGMLLAYGEHSLTISGDVFDEGLVEPRALDQKRSITFTITINVVRQTSGCPQPGPSLVPPRPFNPRNRSTDGFSSNGAGWNNVGGGSGGSSGSGSGSGGSGGPRLPLRQPPQSYMWGDPHYHTVDGLAYTSLHLGEFIAMTDVISGTDGLQLQVRHERLPGFPDWASFSTAAVIGYAGHRIEVQLPTTATIAAPLINLVNGQFSYRLPGRYVLADPSGSGRALTFDVEPGNSVTAYIPDPDHPGKTTIVRMGVRNDNFIGNTEPFRSLEVVVTTEPLTLTVRYRGVLGTPNGNPNDDLSDPAGAVIELNDFFEAWRITNTTQSLFTYLPPAIGPQSYNIVQTATIPDFSIYTSQVEAAIRDQCGVDPSLVSPVFIDQMSLELAAGRTITNIIAGGLCQNGQVSAAVVSPAEFAGFYFYGQTRYSGDPSVGVSGASIKITANELGGRVMCDTGTFAEGYFECSLADLASAFGNLPPSVTMQYTVTGQGAPVMGSFVMPIPQPGEWSDKNLNINVTPSRLVKITGSVVFTDGTPLQRGVIQVTGPSFARYSTANDGTFAFYIPLPEGATSVDLELDAFTQFDNWRAKRRVSVAPLTLGVTNVEVPAMVLMPGMPPSDSEATLASTLRSILFTGKVANTSPAGADVGGLQVRILSTGIAGGVCLTATNSDGTYLCRQSLTTSKGFTGQLVVSGLGANEVYTIPFAVSDTEIPAPGGLAAKRLDAAGSFQTRWMTIYFNPFNVFVDNNWGSSSLSGYSGYSQVTISSPTLGVICRNATYVCSARVIVTDTVELIFDVSGDWGSSTYITHTNISPSGPINLNVEIPVSPTTVLLTGRVTQFGSLPLPNAFLRVNYAESLVPQGGLAYADANGTYTMYLTLKNNVISDTFSVFYDLDQFYEGDPSEVARTIEIPVNNIRLSALNVVLQPINFITRPVMFSARRVINGHYSGYSGSLEGEHLTIFSDGQSLCSGELCRVILDSATPFDAQFTVSGTWGVATATYVIDPATIEGTRADPRMPMEVPVTAYPTMVRIEGQIRKAGMAVPYADVYLKESSASYVYMNGFLARTDGSGRFTTYATIKQGITSGPLQLEVQYRIAGTYYSQIVTLELSNLAVGQVNTISPVINLP